MILERLKQYMDYKGITVAAFERSIGMANASFGKSLKKGGAIGTDKLENILTIYPDISPLWLLRGVGEMLLPDPEHPEKQPPSAPTYLLDMIKEKDQIIRQQAEELGEQAKGAGDDYCADRYEDLLHDKRQDSVF